ncbi:MAG: DUF3494 domain-containing protein [Thermoplasmata archaeon]|nr:DUF3494 domain-containing protein [Thermoplasmata archaeon]
MKAQLALLVALSAIVAISLLLTSSALGAPQISFGSSSVTTTGAGSSASHGVATKVFASGGAVVSCGQAKIALGAAGNFRVLAGTTVTNTGNTVVKGNLGVSPGTAITGFGPGKVTGTIHAGDTAAAAAQTDLVTAYNDGMGRTNCPTAVAGNLGGQTLGPGLYKSTSSLSISSGDLTLTAHGHPGAVFIFQVASKFTTTSGRHVYLSAGAQAANIYWVIGSSATLGTTSVVFGNILAHKSISLATGAVLHGKALAHLGAVTLAGNIVYRHAPFLGATASVAGSTSGRARPGA